MQSGPLDWMWKYSGPLHHHICPPLPYILCWPGSRNGIAFIFPLTPVLDHLENSWSFVQTVVIQYIYLTFSWLLLRGEPSDHVDLSPSLVAQRPFQSNPLKRTSKQANQKSSQQRSLPPLQLTLPSTLCSLLPLDPAAITSCIFGKRWPIFLGECCPIVTFPE